MATKLESPQSSACDVPWRSLATMLIGTTGTLLAWHWTNVLFLFPAGVTVTMILSCWARGHEPAELKLNPARTPIVEIRRQPILRTGLYQRPRPEPMSTCSCGRPKHRPLLTLRSPAA